VDESDGAGLGHGPTTGADGDASYALLDVGDLRRLERFGARVLDRPAQSEGGFPPRDPDAWATADARFEPAADGTGRWIVAVPGADAPWTVVVAGLTFELRLAPSGQVGCFPEQVPNWRWIADRLGAPAEVGRPVAAAGGEADRSGIAVDDSREVLNLFAYTGGSTLAAARSGARVVHVDAGRAAVAWARRNAGLSDLAAAPIRWIVDDALAFTRREARRERRYAGIVLDPPSFGHGPGGRPWQLETGLAELLEACAAILARQRAFVVLTAHTPGFGPDRLAEMLETALLAEGHTPRDGVLEAGELGLVAATGRTLDLGAVVRWST
jgi:23S rRNA (cytosine1962-C5)-methyltransferase